ncbi:MAG: hypothetical protein KDK28_12485 [Maritimibacter sp.]|nr:hypothetical protein [Maritimibacter sp.]
MLRRLVRRSSAALLLLLPACGLVGRCSGPAALDQSAFDVLYSSPAPVATGPLQVYHLGHSLVGRDMPVMLTQLATAGLGAEGHDFASQLGWGATLREHFEPDVAVKGFAEENTHPQHRDPHEALKSGEYDAVVLTEAVEIRDSIKYQATAEYLAKWAEEAWDGKPLARVYLYETWHELDGAEDWLARLEGDLAVHWEAEILRPALANQDHLIRPIFVIPGGQVMAAFIRRLETAGGIGPLTDRHDLFSDNIHFNDYGAYLMALTHYAVLYGRSPVGLPHALAKADGTPAADPGPAAAQAMQEVVWEVVTAYPPTGVAAP